MKRALIGGALLAISLIIVNFVAVNIQYQPSVEVSEFIIDDGKQHPLVVVFGGSEGGDSFKNSSWAPQSLQKLGFSVISVAYFGSENTPPYLKNISLNEIVKEIRETAKKNGIDNRCISLIGGSRGGELALLLASLFDDFDLVIAQSPSHVIWPAVFVSIPQQSAWKFDGKPMAFLPTEQFSYSQFSGYLSGNTTEPFLNAMKNNDAVEDALIKVENIKGPILLISGKNDEVWPSTMMSNHIVERLERLEFQYEYKHIVQNTGHNVLSESTTWSESLKFLDKHINKNRLCEP